MEASRSELSHELRAWLGTAGPKTVGSLVDVFGEKSFAVVFVVLLAPSALPLPTGGVTQLLELIAAVIAAQLVVGRDEIWLPKRWRDRQLTSQREQRFIASLARFIGRLERVSKPRLAFLYGSRPSNAVFGLVVIIGCISASLAPPFTFLDTLPALGVVLVSMSVLLEDIAVAIVGLVALIAGILLELLLGKAAIDAIADLF